MFDIDMDMQENVTILKNRIAEKIHKPPTEFLLFKSEDKGMLTDGDKIGSLQLGNDQFIKVMTHSTYEKATTELYNLEASFRVQI